MIILTSTVILQKKLNSDQNLIFLVDFEFTLYFPYRALKGANYCEPVVSVSPPCPHPAIDNMVDGKSILFPSSIGFAHFGILTLWVSLVFKRRYVQ